MWAFQHFFSSDNIRHGPYRAQVWSVVHSSASSLFLLHPSIVIFCVRDGDTRRSLLFLLFFAGFDGSVAASRAENGLLANSGNSKGNGGIG